MKRRALLASAGALAASCTLPLAPGATFTFGSPTAAPTRDRVAELLAPLSLEQRAGQLMSVAFHGPAITPAIEAMIRRRAVGGLVLRTENADSAAALASLAADLQRVARDAGVPPLLLSLDQEGGSVVRVQRGMTALPGEMALAATPSPADSVRRAVAVTAAELAGSGVRWNLAPDADVNDEPRNPIIGNRSFGSDPQRVAALVDVAVRAYEAGGILCCAKHFPGHGSTDVDSHTGLPVSGSDRAHLDRVELAPFRAAIAAGVPAIMSAHIVVPALDPTPGLPVTLSWRVMTDLLRGTLGFTGLAVTDDLEMGALASIGEAQAGLRAFAAGADHLLFRFDEAAQVEGHRLIVAAVRDGRVGVARLDDAVRRVLAAKIAAGLFDASPAGRPDPAAGAAVALDLARQSVTLLRNEGALPLRGTVYAVATRGADIASAPGDSDLATELAAVRANVVARPFAFASDAFIASAVAEARSADVVVAAVADIGSNEDERRLVNALAAARPTVLVSLRAPYDVLYADGVAAVVCGYGGRVPTLRAVAEVLTGSRTPTGTLPVVIPGHFPLGAGMRDFA